MFNTKAIISVFIIIVIVNFSFQNKCHPQCSWKCDDPHCPAICDPVCEQPKCHTSCAEPKNALCDVKCEKPECEIKCPDKGCEMNDCPKCVTVCKQPHCVTHCQAPKPECEAVCEEPKCDWKCHKPTCPKPKCELICENPNCVPKVECCPCAMGASRLAVPMPFFKEVESNKDCCSCNKAENNNFNFKQIPNVVASNIPQIIVKDKSQFKTSSNTSILEDKNKIIKNEKKANLELFNVPVVNGSSSYLKVSHPNSDEYQRDLNKLNIDLIHKN